MRYTLVTVLVVALYSGVGWSQLFTFTENQSIPDGAQGITLNQPVSGGPTEIADLNVYLDITGDFNGDLFVTLTHDSGYSVLLNRVGKTASNSFGYPDPGMDVK